MFFSKQKNPKKITKILIFNKQFTNKIKVNTYKVVILTYKNSNFVLNNII